jgi:hypothetical protein
VPQGAAMKELNLDKIMSAEERQKLSKLSLGDEVTIQGKKYRVEKRFSKGSKQAATLVPV